MTGGHVLLNTVFLIILHELENIKLYRRLNFTTLYNVGYDSCIK